MAGQAQTAEYQHSSHWHGVGSLVHHRSTVVGALCRDGWSESGWGAASLAAMCFFGLYFFCELVGILVAGSIWVLTLGGVLVGKARFLSAHYALQRGWSQTLFRGSFGLFSMSIDVEGESVAREGPYVLFVRHSSSADTVLAAGVFPNPQRRRFRYVLKQELLWDPCLDIVGCRLPNVFVNRRAAQSGEQVLAVADLARHLGR